MSFFKVMSSVLFQGISFCKGYGSFCKGYPFARKCPWEGQATFYLFLYIQPNSCFEWLENLKQLQRRCTCMYMPGSCVDCNMLHLDTPHIWMLVFDHFAVPVMTAKHFLGLCYLKKPFARLQNILLQGTVQTFCKGKPFTRQGPFARGHPFARVTFCKAIHEESLGEGVLNPFTRAAFWEDTLLQGWQGQEESFCKVSAGFCKDALLQGFPTLSQGPFSRGHLAVDALLKALFANCFSSFASSLASLQREAHFTRAGLRTSREGFFASTFSSAIEPFSRLAASSQCPPWPIWTVWIWPFPRLPPNHPAGWSKHLLPSWPFS